MNLPRISLQNDRQIGQNEPVFIIAEIGQNHQGDMTLARELIKLAKDVGADCVKFQKSNLTTKFTQKKLNQEYNSINSFGSTYGEHKLKLEFNEQQFKQLQSFANDLDILFTASAMDIDSLDFLISIDVPFIKIGSGDTNNFPMIEKASKCTNNLPIIMSTGMSNLDTVIRSHDILKHGHPSALCPTMSNDGHGAECINSSRTNIAILHCVSSYPTPINEINLNVINGYKKLFPGSVIGYSGHEQGIEVSFAAVTKLNASIIERHLTLDKSMKGTDHKCSLNGHEFKLLVQKIRHFEATRTLDTYQEHQDIDLDAEYFGSEKKKRQPSEMSCWFKLGKSVVSRTVLNVGHVIERSDLCIKVSTEPKGIPGEMFYDVIGKTVLEEINCDEAIQSNQIN